MQQVSSADPLCPRELGVYTATVTNTEATTQTYTLEVSGSAAAWATVTPQGMVLAPQESKIVYLYLVPSEAAAPKIYSLKLRVSSSSETKEIFFSPLVKDCYGLDLFTAESKQQACPADLLSYTFSVQNNGDYVERIDLSAIGNLASFLELDQNSFLLNPGQSKQVKAYAKAPENAGIYDSTLFASSSKSKKAVSFELKVNPCYDYIVDVLGETSFDKCEFTPFGTSFKIKNQGSITNTYKLVLDGVSWGRLTKNTIILSSHSEEQVGVLFGPDFGVEGKFPTKIEITPQFGKKEIISLDLNVRSCHLSEIEVEEKLSLCKETRAATEFFLTNKGEFDKTYLLSLKGPEWVSLESSSLSLRKGETKPIRISFQVPALAEAKDYSLELEAKASDESGERTQKKIDLKVIETETCFETSLSAEHDDITIYFDSSLAVPIMLRNDGLQDAEYSFFLTGEAASFARLNPSALALQRGETKTTYLFLAPLRNTTIKKYDLSLSVQQERGPQVASKDFVIRITDNKEKATVINLSSGQEGKYLSAFFIDTWSWLKNTFKPQQVVNLTAEFEVPGVTQESSEENIKKASQLWTSLEEYRYYILGVMILLLLFALLVRLGVFTRLSEFLEEEIEEDEILRESNSKKEEEHNEVSSEVTEMKKAVEAETEKDEVKKKRIVKKKTKKA